MDIRITPSPLRGGVTAIGSKSCAHRALICAALADADTFVEIAGSSQDIDATADCLKGLGAAITREKNGFHIRPGEPPAHAALDCRESGSTLRFLLPVAAALCGDAAFTGAGRLPERPLSPLTDALAKHGCTFTAEKLPLKVTKICGGGAFTLPGNISSQFITGLLLASPLMQGGAEIKLASPLESADYVNITIDMMSRFGVTAESTADGFAVAPGQSYASPGKLAIEGDWSNAAFWLTAGALSGGVLCANLNKNSKQGDRAVADILRAMGCRVFWKDGFLTAAPKPFTGLNLDAAAIPDLVPILAVAASVAEGQTRITGAARLRLKESDRIASTCAMLLSLGADARETPDGLTIQGQPHLSGGTVDSFGDHRIAMAAAIASCVCEKPVIIKNARVVEKSYPAFWQDFKKLGGMYDVL